MGGSGIRSEGRATKHAKAPFFLDNLTRTRQSSSQADIEEPAMKTMTVGELKAQFSEVLGQMVKSGEPIAISFGKKKKKSLPSFRTANSNPKPSAHWA
jgi:hypothetical protein